ncbi:hypothetical protein Back11_48370 [Paenibacillus baekrokdamisoli]|uniref:Rhamnogalacturonase A/B/Epimerase-like pectate lyase domain-containing protein n=1 Tax=Paenibacillus baekrokdamisoli TaxID=1712516 RepID=A0A3G9IYY3_9BACL|nr:glycosyl hydrolase family 28-related protein [Paenibacillus baekrokdamisoli]MBB3068660.1 hypothetical protein [Paenibacillus baekrokdamisoli]BBH23492.1 hypothetical protein Back11_48370 [Paenibacillus baekrokdamisoli]
MSEIMDHSKQIDGQQRTGTGPDAGADTDTDKGTLSRRKFLTAIGGLGAVVATGGLLFNNPQLASAKKNSENSINTENVIYLNSVADIQTLDLSTLTDGQQFSVRCFHPNTTIGGGIFYLNKTRAKSAHNGGTIVSTTVPWNGTVAGLPGFLNGTGETNPTGSGCLVRLYGERITSHMFGARGNSTDDDTTAIQAAINVGIPLYFPEGTYLLKLSQSITLAGGPTVCSLIARDKMNLLGAGIGKTIFKLKDNESTDSSPKYFNIIAGNTVINNLYVEGITFDVNGANNKISPNRSSGSYYAFNCAGIFISGTVATSGSDARLYNSKITNCEFINSPGVTCIATGQQESPGVISNNVEISFCRFYNNGIDSSDHSSVYMWGDSINVHDCVFDHPTVSTGIAGPVVAAELHGSENFFTNNIVNNYAQGVWISGNQKTPSRGISVTGNSFTVSWFGVGLFSINPIGLGTSDVLIGNNRIYIIAGEILNPGMGFPKTAVFLNMQDGGGDRMTVTGNQLYCTDRSSNIAVLVSAAAGGYMRDTLISDNLVNGFCRGICVGLGALGSAYNTTIKSNTICNLQRTTNLPATVGIHVSGTQGGVILSSNDIGGGTGTTDQGIFIGGATGALEFLHFEGNRVDASASSSIEDSIIVTGRRSGEQALTFTALPAQSTWKKGDSVTLASPIQAGTAPNKYMIVGWQRITNGTANVLNTDWLERRVLTGN